MEYWIANDLPQFKTHYSKLNIFTFGR